VSPLPGAVGRVLTFSGKNGRLLPENALFLRENARKNRQQEPD
jgi:hypothetical protein